MTLLIKLFITFFKIGLFTFGGGYAMLPMIQEQVQTNGWITSRELVDFIAVSESTPGPFAINISTYIGMEKAGIPGALCATVGVALPSFLIIIFVAKCYEKFKTSTVVKGCMTGLKPGVIGLIAAAAVSVATTVFFPDGIKKAVLQTPEIYISTAVFLIMCFLAFKKKHPILIICFSAVIGIAAGYFFGM